MKRSRQWIDWIFALSLAAVGVYLVIWQNSHLAVLWDLSYILENSYRISLGQVPYRDFPFPYAPLTFLTQAALIKLTGRVFFHHVIYCAVVNGLSIIVTWRVLLRVLKQTNHGRLLALVLTVPLTVLGIYSIFPHPFYDCDCTFAILVCLLLLLRFQDEERSFVDSFGVGAVLVIPLFIKQNTGGAFLIAVVSCLLALFFFDVFQRRGVRKYIALFTGLLASFSFALFLIHHCAGLQNYYQWTIRFAAQRRTPQLAQMIGMYREAGVLWWLCPVVLGLFLSWLFRRHRAGQWFGLVLLLVPFVWPVVYLLRDSDASERAERLVNLWPLVLVLSVVAMVLVVVRRRSFSQLLVPLIIVATAHGAFMSQQLWGSTYALWPLFVILVAFIVVAIGKAELERLSLTFVSILSLSLLIAGAFYLRSHERLEYANLDDGELTHSTNPVLHGMTTRGTWLTDFDELVAYANKNIPAEDAILCLPGEDPFYYTTGRRPQFPVVMFDHTINPYSSQEIVDLARSRNIKWLIVKDELQLEEEPIENRDELMSLLEKEFESVDSLNNYEIYQRKSADDKDDESEEEPK